jgi:hypothetical protein
MTPFLCKKNEGCLQQGDLFYLRKVVEESGKGRIRKSFFYK